MKIDNTPVIITCKECGYSYDTYDYDYETDCPICSCDNYNPEWEDEYD